MNSPVDRCTHGAGTQKYFSPERINQNFGTGADIWALGVSMIEIYQR